MLAFQALDILRDHLVLVARAGEVLAETTAGGVKSVDFPIGAEAVGRSHGHGLRLEALRCSDGRDIWARRREGGHELGGILPIVGNANTAVVTSSITHATIARAEEDRNATCTELCEAVADPLGIVEGDSLLVVAVGGADDLGEAFLGKDVVDPDQVRLISRGVTSCRIRYLGRRTVGGEGGDRHGVGHADDSLDIEIGFNRDTLLRLCRCESRVLGRPTSNVDELVLRGSSHGVWPVSCEELLGIWSDWDFAEKVVEPDLIFVCSLLHISFCLV